MILVTCGYMLDSILAVLTRRGIPFANQYRPSQYNWNPLDLPGGRTSEADPVRALLRNDVEVYGDDAGPRTYRDLLDIAGVLSPGIFRQDLTPQDLQSWHGRGSVSSDALVGGYEALRRMGGSSPADPALLEIVLTAESCAGLLSVDPINWFERNLEGTHKRSRAMKLALNICRKRSKRELVEKPRVTVGTMHSVKGGQADVVYLFPDLSTSGYECWEGMRPQRDSVRRLMYVGMTRARESLVICEPYKAKFSADGL